MYFLDKKTTKKYLLLTIVVAVLFFVGISIYMIKDLSGANCGTDRTNTLSASQTSFSGLKVIDSKYYLQSVSFDNKKFPYHEEYKYCIRSTIVTDDFLKINVLDSEETILGTGYFSNSSNTYSCIPLRSNDFLLKNNYIGFSCVNCDGVTNNLTVYDANEAVKTLTTDGNDLIDKFDVDVVAVMNCKHISFNLFKYLMLFLLLMSIFLLIDFLVGKTKEIGFDGWE